MSSSNPDWDLEQLKRDIHGERVGRNNTFCCDFCEVQISLEEPVMYDIVSVYDLANIEALSNPPKGWILDAARCENCEVDAVEPKTDGWKEAVVLFSIAESNGILSADASELTLIDYSPGDEGHHPPSIPLSALTTPGGVSMARWGYLKTLLATTAVEHEQFDVYRDMLTDMEKESTD
ncbi:hypothetical protein AUR64_04370 [Haloprofundus marisrubri]|uniref:Uncharacterized protein n=1 Tax=Haloprofundus marisrubri TaxID=1514971 RepID=A0A0W1RD50_9EURY|nr:hypothetical protein [Haloprofundus marisrubri]KTG11322.1 hypothetical protein AUR64_04370 [Haloprofundus marisrubri]